MMTTSSMPVTNALRNLFSFYDALSSGYISTLQVQRLHQEIRIGGISIPQVLASLKYKNVEPNRILLTDLPTLLEEMDRRYYLIQDLQWEYALMDGNHQGLIPVKSARFLMEARHGHAFSERRWKQFLDARPVPNAPISFAEMEVELCNVMQPDKSYITEAADKNGDSQNRQAKLKMVEEQKRLENQRRKEEQDRIKAETERRIAAEREAKRKQEEEKLRQEEMERVQKAEMAEADEKNAEEEEARARQQEQMLLDRAKKEADADKKKKAEEEAKLASKRRKEAREKRIRSKLKVAVESIDRQKLTKATEDFKNEKLADTDGDLAKAERLLKMFKCSDALKDGISKRLVEQLENAIGMARKSGFDRNELRHLVVQADELLLRLRRLERLRHEVLELKSSTIAEIRSYKSPPPIVHNVMIATYLLLGTQENETKKWPNVQVLLGKTGREGLKRRIMQLKVTDVDVATATKAKAEIGDVDLETIRDVSAGAATFFVWVEGMVEEVLNE